jgi:hypothetical protein
MVKIKTEERMKINFKKVVVHCNFIFSDSNDCYEDDNRMISVIENYYIDNYVHDIFHDVINGNA